MSRHILWHSMHQEPFSTQLAGLKEVIFCLAFCMPPASSQQVLYAHILLHALMQLMQTQNIRDWERLEVFEIKSPIWCDPYNKENKSTVSRRNGSHHLGLINILMKWFWKNFSLNLAFGFFLLVSLTKSEKKPSHPFSQQHSLAENVCKCS